jgi:hypothetical protein
MFHVSWHPMWAPIQSAEGRWNMFCCFNNPHFQGFHIIDETLSRRSAGCRPLSKSSRAPCPSWKRRSVQMLLGRWSHDVKRNWCLRMGLSMEQLQESRIFNGKIYGFRFWFSLKPIHWGYDVFSYFWFVNCIELSCYIQQCMLISGFVNCSNLICPDQW